MNERLQSALLAGAISAATALVVCLWRNLPMKLAIVCVVGIMGFLLGLVFKVRAV